MSRRDAHERFEELAAGHAMSALEPADEQAFLEHLSACALCERGLDSHLETLSHLAYAAPSAEPPPALLDRIRADVRADGREVTFPGETAEEPGAPASLAAARERRRGALARWSRSGGLVGAAAAVALIASLVTWNASLQRERDAQLAWSDRLAQTVQALEDQATATVPLSSDDGRVLAVAVMQGSEMSLVVDGLEPNDVDGTTYVLWGKSRFGDVREVGSFDVTQPGLDVLHGMTVPEGIADVETFMITHEPTAVAPPVTTQPVLVAGDA